MYSEDVLVFLCMWLFQEVFRQAYLTQACVGPAGAIEEKEEEDLGNARKWVSVSVWCTCVYVCVCVCSV